MALTCPGYVCSLGLSTLCPDPNPKSSRLAGKHEKIIQEMEGKSTVLVGVPCFRGREPQRTIHLGPGRRLRRFSGLRSVTSGPTARVEVLRYLALRQGCEKALGVRVRSCGEGQHGTLQCGVGNVDSNSPSGLEICVEAFSNENHLLRTGPRPAGEAWLQ